MPPRVPRALAFALGACLFGCDLPQNLGDLGGSLLDPAAELLDTPGRQLAAGSYSRLELDGSLESGGWVVAKRHDLETNAVSIISFVGDGQCELSGAADFQRVSSRVDIALPGLIAFQREPATGDPRAVEFAGFDCQPRLEPVGADVLPTMPFPRSSPRGLLLLDREGRLLLVDAKAQRLREITTGVRSGNSEGERLWLFEKRGTTDVLVVYDADLKQTASWPEISDLYILSSWSEHDAVIRDSEGLHFVDATSDDKELIDAEGCAPFALGPQVLAYFAPCSERHLRLSVPGVLVGREEDRFTIDIGPEVVAHTEIIPYWQGTASYLLYQVGSDSTVGELRAAEHLGEDPDDRPADRLLLPQSRLSRSLIFGDWDGASGTLMVPRIKSRDGISELEGLDPLAPRVVHVPGGDPTSERGVLTEYDGRVGKLMRFIKSEAGYEGTLLASDVPIQTQVVDAETGAIGFVGDLESSGRGTAYLMTGGRVRAIGERALPGTLRFLEQPKALAYLAHDGSGVTAELRAWLIDSALNVRVSEHVSEYRELPWPSAGLLYAVGQGNRAGIWFARAR